MVSAMTNATPLDVDNLIESPSPSESLPEAEAPDDRAGYVSRLVAARCPELNDLDLALIGGTPVVPAKIAELITEALGAIDERIVDLEERMDAAEAGA
jgi:hypothetical protein